MRIVYKRRTEIEQKYGDKLNYAYEKYLMDRGYPEIVNRKEFASQLATLGGG